MAIELEYTIEVLEETPARVARFLQGVGAVPVIRTLLASAGMKDQDILEGRTALMACLAEPAPPAQSLDTTEAKSHRAAVTEIDQWDEPNFHRYGATLKRHHRSAYDYVFHDLSASQGPGAVAGVALFLTRIAALAAGTDPARSASKANDAAAVTLLEARGLTKAERDRVQALVDLALAPTQPLSAAAQQAPSEERLMKLSNARAWFDEWSSVARAVVKKRSYLLRLGLAKRKSRGAPDETGGGTASAPAPAK